MIPNLKSKTFPNTHNQNMNLQMYEHKSKQRNH